MTPFGTILVVDWASGNDSGPTPKRDAIWAAMCRDGACRTEYLRNRQVAEAWLAQVATTEAAAGRRVLAGFDFPFGYPQGFAERVVGRPDPLALWDWLDANLTDTPRANDRFALAARLNGMFPGRGPFWFNGTSTAHPDLPHKGRERQGHGLPEKRLAEHQARGAFTLWQMGGAGAVGGQAITGMAMLSRLRRWLGAAVSVWPFQPDDAPVRLVEVWPSLLRDEVRATVSAAQAAGGRPIRDEVQVRLLAGALARMQADGTLAAALAAVPREAAAEEGWILGLGAQSDLRAAAARLSD